MMMQLPELNAFKDIPGYKAILKAVIKSQIQFLVEQLSHQTGEESVLLTASISDGTLSHLGSESGKVFLEKNDDFKSQFLGFCIKRHHNTTSKTGVKKKPPTAKRSVPFCVKLKAKRQHTEPYPVSFAEKHLQNSLKVPKLPLKPEVETELIGEPNLKESFENKDALNDNDDAASDKTVENYPTIKTEPVDTDSLENPDYETLFEASVSGLDTTVTNGENTLKGTGKANMSVDDQTCVFENDINASIVKLEYSGNDYVTDESGNTPEISRHVHDESASFDYGQSSGALSEHQLFFSHAEPTPKKKRIYKRGGSRPCTCEYCGKVIKRGSDMKKHQRIHTGVKPFGCDFCGKLFNQSSALSIHRRIHTGEKPYICNLCGIRFRRKDTLAIHQRQCMLETGDIKIECNTDV